MFCVLVGGLLIWVSLSQRPGTPKPSPAPTGRAPAAAAQAPAPTVPAPAAEVPEAPQGKRNVAAQPALREGARPTPNEGETGVAYRAMLGQLSSRFGLSDEQVTDKLVTVHDMVKKETGAELTVLDIGQVLAASSESIATLAGSVPAALEGLHRRLPRQFPPSSAAPFDEFAAIFTALVVQKVEANPDQPASWAANEVGKDLVALCWKFQ